MHGRKKGFSAIVDQTKVDTGVFNHQEQIAYIKLALAMFDAERTSIANLETILAFGELIKRHSSEENAAIYDATEYFYEQLRLLRNEDGTYDDSELRNQLEAMTRLPQ